ncbi:MAG: dihydropteroate synthase [Chitinophagales bacterium]
MTINCRGRLIDLSSPVVMGILNLTPDSFYKGSRVTTEKQVLARARKMLADGATILDLGGMSSRPGAKIISERTEVQRILPHVSNILKHLPNAIISIDTIHASVAERCLKEGAHIINDISAGTYDKKMLKTVSAYKAPFIAMHMKGLPQNMQLNPRYKNVVTEVMDYLAKRITACRKAGIVDVIIDPGFGFGKTLEHNYTLLRNLNYFTELNVPVLAGLSRKGMIYKILETDSANALNGTTAANTVALLKGARIVRVHDVKEATEAIKVVKATSH